MEHKFSVDRGRLRALLEEGEAAFAALRKAQERLKDAQQDACEALRDLDEAKARKASKPRYLDSEIEEAEQARHESACAAAQAIYQEKLDAVQAAQGKYAARQAVAFEAGGLARACEDFAAARGVRA